MVRVERVELSSQVWKTWILTAIRHPRAFIIAHYKIWPSPETAKKLPYSSSNAPV